jgi:hypothetical protein
MRKILLATASVALCLMPSLAFAKLPYFGLDVEPTRPGVGDPITITMTCYHDEDHSMPMSSCLGGEGVMAWVHPLDDVGELDRSDWIAVPGHPTSSGASSGRITLDEAGSYDVLPLWRNWSTWHIDGFPRVIRIEVTPRARSVPWVIAAVGIAGAWAGVATRRRRSSPRR